MAASDPGTYVPTLGGQMPARAVFYWSGSAWVNGTAVPETYVPTLGGRMEAMAPFYWSGSAWVAYPAPVV